MKKIFIAFTICVGLCSSAPASELLVRVVDKTNATDIYKDCQLTKEGMVIVVEPDGWKWSKKELTNPEWRVVISNLKVEEARDLYLAPQDDGVPVLDKNHLPNPEKSKTLLRRANKIDVKDPLLIAAGIEDPAGNGGVFGGGDTTPIFQKVDINAVDMKTLTEATPIVHDPAKIAVAPIDAVVPADAVVTP